MPFLTRGPLSGVSGAPPLQAAHTTLTCVLFQLHTLLFACVVWKAAGRSAHRCLCTGLEKAQEIWVCLRVINHISLCFPQRTTALIPTAWGPCACSECSGLSFVQTGWGTRWCLHPGVFHPYGQEATHHFDLGYSRHVS